MTPRQAAKLTPLLSPYPDGKPGEVYVGVIAVRAATGLSPETVQSTPFYLRPGTIEEGGFGKAVYILDAEAFRSFTRCVTLQRPRF